MRGIRTFLRRIHYSGAHVTNRNTNEILNQNLPFGKLEIYLSLVSVYHTRFMYISLTNATIDEYYDAPAIVLFGQNFVMTYR